MLINKKRQVKQKNFRFTENFFSLKLVRIAFAGTVFVRTVFVVSLISSHLIIESSTILPKYLSFPFFAHMMFAKIFALTPKFIVILLLIWVVSFQSYFI